MSSEQDVVLKRPYHGLALTPNGNPALGQGGEEGSERSLASAAALLLHSHKYQPFSPATKALHTFPFSAHVEKRPQPLP